VTAVKGFEASRKRMNREIYNILWRRILGNGFRKGCEENNFAL